MHLIYFVLAPFASSLLIGDSQLATPDGDYAPADVGASNYITPASVPGLSQNETQYLENRTEAAFPAVMQYLEMSGLDLSSFSDLLNSTSMPRIGIAVSGGGLRALLNGAGFLKALDYRSGNASSVAGILQSALYVTGLSGGSWILGAMISNEFETIDNLTDQNFNFDDNFITNNPSDEDDDGVSYYLELMREVDEKADNGFPITVTDFWGRVIQNFVKPDSLSFTMSDIRNQTWFQNHSYPFPIFVTNYRIDDTKTDDVNQPIFEITPYEFKSNYPEVAASFPILNVGTKTSDGRTEDENQVVQGFDQFGFCMGTSASIFNIVNPETFIPDSLSFIYKLVSRRFSSPNDVALWPNPFNGFKTGTALYDEENIELVDGGFNLQGIPIAPLLDRQRALDVLFLSDSTNDSDDNYPTGEEFVQTYTFFKSKNLNDYGINLIPELPDKDTFLSDGLDKRNVIFGVGDNADINTPVVIYFPNREVSYDSGTSTYKLSYSNDERDGIIQNGFNIATNGTSMGGTFSQCIACAMTERLRMRNNISRPQACVDCYQIYAYN